MKIDLFLRSPVNAVVPLIDLISKKSPLRLKNRRRLNKSFSSKNCEIAPILWNQNPYLLKVITVLDVASIFKIKHDVVNNWTTFSWKTSISSALVRYQMQ